MTAYELIQWANENIQEYLLLEMKNTDHGYKGSLNPYHTEGTVWTHTMMVMKEVEHLSEEQKVNDTLMIVALLHDIGKPFSIEPDHETKKVWFKGHEGLSMYLSVEITQKMVDDGLIDQEQRIWILRLIAEHGTLYRLGEKKIKQRYDHEREYLDLLLRFTYCDHAGRFHLPKENENDYIKITQDILNSEPNKLNKVDLIEPYLVLMIGPPGSGKSTYIKRYSSVVEGIVISRDKYVEERGKGNDYNEKWSSLSPDNQKEIDSDLFNEFKMAVKEKRNIVVDMTNMSAKSRRKWINNVTKDYVKVAMIMMTDYHEIFERNKNRTEKSIPEFVIINMMKSFSFPNYDEFDDIRILGL